MAGWVHVFDQATKEQLAAKPDDVFCASRAWGNGPLADLPGVTGGVAEGGY